MQFILQSHEHIYTKSIFFNFILIKEYLVIWYEFYIFVLANRNDGY
jgi:hypothetical protein